MLRFNPEQRCDPTVSMAHAYLQRGMESVRMGGGGASDGSSLLSGGGAYSSGVGGSAPVYLGAGVVGGAAVSYAHDSGAGHAETMSVAAGAGAGGGDGGGGGGGSNMVIAEQLPRGRSNDVQFGG